jgi:ABC-type cobalamin/Fe3+-siderophores transport system ATPase subunit
LFEKFKYYPEKKGDYLYGASFADIANDNPKSALILGNNGVGKTSIYQIIEYLFRKQIGEALLRDYGNKQKLKEDKEKCYGEYLPNKEYGNDEIRAEIETKSNRKLDINNLLITGFPTLRECLQNLFFISDYEIYKLGRLKYENGGKNSFRKFMADSLDFGELAWFNRLICKLCVYDDFSSESKVDDKSADVETKNREEQNIKSYKEAIKQLSHLQQDRLERYILHVKQSKHNDYIIFLYSLISAVRQLNQNYNPHNIADLKNEYKKFDLYIDSINKENEIIRDITLFNSLLKHNQDLLSYLNTLKSKILFDHVDIEVLRLQCNQFLAETQLPHNKRFITNEYIDERKAIIADITKKIQGENIDELLDKLIGSVKNYTLSEKNISDEEKTMDDTIFKNTVINVIKQEAKEIYDIINDKITAHFNESVEEIEDIINKVMRHFLNDDETFEWIHEDLTITDTEFKPRYLSLSINKMENERNSKMGVKRYFNTFRYHLFCILLVIAASFAVKKKLKVNIPIVIDDIFHANDFTNRTKIQKLVNTIIDSHDDIFGNDPSMELQLIIFTHDDLIFNSIKKILEKKGRQNFGFYRLLGYEQAKEDHAKELNNILYEYK